MSLAIVKPPIDPGPYHEFLFYPKRRDRDRADHGDEFTPRDDVVAGARLSHFNAEAPIW